MAQCLSPVWRSCFQKTWRDIVWYLVSITPPDLCVHERCQAVCGWEEPIHEQDSSSNACVVGGSGARRAS